MGFRFAVYDQGCREGLDSWGFGFHWGNIRVILGIMEKKMETTIMGLGCSAWGLGFEA